MGSTGTDASSLEHAEVKPFRLLGSTRLGVSLTGFFGCALVYALRSNASFAIVCMVNGTAVELLTETTSETKRSSCAIEGTPSNNTKNAMDGELIWSKQLQGSVLSAFFWGYLFTQVLGGYLSALMGGKIVIGSAVLASAVLTLLSPIAATTHVYIFIVIRAALGVVQGTVFPAYHTFFSLWAPPMERSFLVGLTLSGAQVGNVLVMPLSGLLCRYGFGGGWPSIFYVLGIAGVVWSLVWLYYVTDSPTENRRIDPNERAYIEASLADIIVKDPSKKKRRIPWRSILTSIPVWAVYCGQFAGDWGAYMMMTSLPLFMNDVLGFDLTSLGFFSAIPYIAYFVVIIVGGMVADKVRDAHLLSTIAVRRLAM
uniref:Major facilitator superfamily (MFS) profile domain-containing protein n=1 Tax=Parascaris univalens TaxID=6257 RepID=A0A915BNU4_PARUN